MRFMNGLVKKVVITALLGIGLSIGPAYAENNLQTVYHVYIDDKHVGVVDRKDAVQSYVDQILDQAKKKYKNFDLEVHEDVSFIAEKTFNSDYNNNQVVRSLEGKLSIAVDAVGLVIGGETVAHLQNQKKADEVITKLKGKYVNPEVIHRLEEREASGKEPSIEVNESTIIDVTLTEKVSKKQKEVKPSNIFTVKEAINTIKKGTREVKTHTITKGEVLGEIAAQYDLSTDQLIKLNPELSENTPLQIGQDLKVTRNVPLTEVIVKEEAKKTEKIEHETEVIKTDELLKGKKKVKQEGKDGKKKVHYYVHIKNGNTVEKGTISEEVIAKPIKEVILKGTKVIPSRGTGDFEWPTAGGTITSYQGSRWGSLHKGIDIAGVSNRTIKAADNGVVVSAGYDGGFGNKIVINHNNGYKTIYAHLSSIKVSVGETVQKGSSIGVMGTTGHSTGVHLHLEIHKNGALKNPMSYY